MTFKNFLIFVSIVALVLKVIAATIPNWGKVDQDGDTLTMGLWQLCDDGTCQKVPLKGHQADNFPTKQLNICRSLVIVGATISIVGLGFLLFKKHYVIHPWLYVLSGLLIISASIVWYLKLLKINQPDGTTVKLKPDYSLYMNAVSGLMHVGLGIIMFYV